MNRLFVILVASLAFAQSLFSQSMSEQQIRDEVYRALKGIESLQCDFTQTKSVKMLAEKVVSSGSMAFKFDKQLLWEYKVPFHHKFVLNGTDVLIQDKDNKEVVNVEKSRIFKEVGKMIKGDVIGESLKGGNVFQVVCSIVNDEYVATFTAQKGQLKRVLAAFSLHISRSSSMPSQIELVGNKGDVTVISFHNVVVNQPVDESLFSIR